MSDEHKNEPRIPIQKSMSTNETRSMPMNSGEKPDLHLNIFDRKTKDENKK